MVSKKLFGIIFALIVIINFFIMFFENGYIIDIDLNSRILIAIQLYAEKIIELKIFLN